MRLENANCMYKMQLIFSRVTTSKPALPPCQDLTSRVVTSCSSPADFLVSLLSTFTNMLHKVNPEKRRTNIVQHSPHVPKPGPLGRSRLGGYTGHHLYAPRTVSAGTKGHLHVFEPAD